MTSRIRTAVLSSIPLVGVAVAFVMLITTEQPARTAGTQGPETGAEIASLEQDLLNAPSATLADALHGVRGMGPKAPATMRARVQGGLSEAGQQEPLPEWVGREPQRAFAAILLEARQGAPLLPIGAAAENAPSERGADMFTLYWQLEYAALSARESPGSVPEEALAALCDAGLERLERDSLETLPAAWLAAAVFRAVPATKDAELEARTRRSFARLGAASRSPGAFLELVAARLEALSTQALQQRAQTGQVDPRTRELLEELRGTLRLGLRRGQLGRGAASASVRALRLARAVLGDTDGVFPQ